MFGSLLKPFLNITFCRKCGNPIPKVGLSLRTGVGNINVSSPYYCPTCQEEYERKKEMYEYLREQRERRYKNK